MESFKTFYFNDNDLLYFINKNLEEMGEPKPREAHKAVKPLSSYTYWSQGRDAIPDDVKSALGKWKTLIEKETGMELNVFDKNLAKQFIYNYCPQYMTPFETAFDYSIESDVFRMAYTKAYNCLWIDPDSEPTEYTQDVIRLSQLEQRSVIGLASAIDKKNRGPRVASRFFIANRNCKFFHAIRKRLENLDFRNFERSSRTLGALTDSGLYTSTLIEMVKQNNIQIRAENGIFIFNKPDTLKPSMFAISIEKLSKNLPELEYKKTNAHWRNSLK